MRSVFYDFICVCDDAFAGMDFGGVLDRCEREDKERYGDWPEMEEKTYKSLYKLKVRLISCAELTAYKDGYVILAGKTFFKKYCKYLGYQGLSDFYSAVPILRDGAAKQTYYAYFASLYRKQKQGVYFGGVEVVLTKRCTLRCKECANLMQYYHAPERILAENILEPLRRLLEAVDGIAFLKLLGGEPLLEQRMIEEILNMPEVVKSGKILGIQIITNGTLVFRGSLLQCMRNQPLVSVLLSNYGTVSNREKEVVSQLEEYGIPYSEISRDDRWTAYGEPDGKYHTKEEADRLFRMCRLKENCCTLLDGSMYTCPRAAHSEALGIYQTEGNEKVDLLSEPYTPVSLREKIHAFYFREQAVQACISCKNVCGESVKRAEQM